MLALRGGRGCLSAILFHMKTQLVTYHDLMHVCIFSVFLLCFLEHPITSLSTMLKFMQRRRRFALRVFYLHFLHTVNLHFCLHRHSLSFFFAHSMQGCFSEQLDASEQSVHTFNIMLIGVI